MRVSALENRARGIEAVIEVLRADVEEIKSLLPTLASKRDIDALGNRISCEVATSINGVLKDALASVPHRQAAVWTAVTAFATAAMVVVMIVQALK